MRSVLTVAMLCAVPAAAQEQLQINVTTTSAGGNYAPRNIAVIWV